MAQVILPILAILREAENAPCFSWVASAGKPLAMCEFCGHIHVCEVGGITSSLKDTSLLNELFPVCIRSLSLLTTTLKLEHNSIGSVNWKSK